MVFRKNMSEGLLFWAGLLCYRMGRFYRIPEAGIAMVDVFTKG